MTDNTINAAGGTAHSRSGRANDKVKVQDWQACIGANGLVESCTVTTNKTSDSITGIGLLAYSADGQTQYCSQFTSGIRGNGVSPSVSSGGFELKVGATILATVFGYVDGQEFFFEQELTIGACGP